MAKYWIKLYTEILRDPKMGRMRDRLWRRAVEMFLFAGQEDDEGFLPEIDEMAWILHVDAEQLETEMTALSDHGILDRRSGRWHVTNYAERQAPVSAAKRMREYRKRQRKEAKEKETEKKQNTYTEENRNASVTGSVTKRNDFVTQTYQGAFQDMMLAVTGVVKTTLAPGVNEGEFESVASALVGYDYTPEQVRQFGDWWKKNGHYTGKPALTSLLHEIQNMVDGVEKDASEPNGVTSSADTAWETLRQAITSTNIRQVGIKALDLPPDIEAAALAVGTPALADLSQYTETKLKAQFAAALQRERHGTSA